MVRVDHAHVRIEEQHPLFVHRVQKVTKDAVPMEHELERGIFDLCSLDFDL